MIDKHANLRSTLTTLIALTAVVPLLLNEPAADDGDVEQAERTAERPFMLTPPLLNVTR